MKKRYRFVRKSYAMRRMAFAIQRAMDARSSAQCDTAIRWVAAWGLLCGIKTAGVRLRDSEVDLAAHLPSDQIAVPSRTAFTLTEEMVAKQASRTAASSQSNSPRRQQGAPDSNDQSDTV
ncbi:MAG: hypothetical protein WKG03_14035 [Telluria sp.]